MSTPFAIDEDTLPGVLAQHRFLLLDFWADWCAPCRQFAPVYAASAARHPEIAFGQIDVDAQPDLARAFRVQSVPTVLVIRDEILVARQPGALGALALEQLIEQTGLIDMDDLRNELAAAEGDADAIDH